MSLGSFLTALTTVLKFFKSYQTYKERKRLKREMAVRNRIRYLTTMEAAYEVRKRPVSRDKHSILSGM